MKKSTIFGLISLTGASMLASIPYQREYFPQTLVYNEVFQIERDLNSLDLKYLDLDKLSKFNPSQIDSITERYRNSLENAINTYGELTNRKDSLKSLPSYCEQKKWDFIKEETSGLAFFVIGGTAFATGLGIYLDERKKERKGKTK